MGGYRRYRIRVFLSLSLLIPAAPSKTTKRPTPSSLALSNPPYPLSLLSPSQARPILPCDELLLSPVDGTVSVLEEHLHPSDSVQLRQVKGVRYSLRSFLSHPFRMRGRQCPAPRPPQTLPTRSIPPCSTSLPRTTTTSTLPRDWPSRSASTSLAACCPFWRPTRRT